VIYCDYNASSPLDSNVCSFLSKGDFLLGNPSAIHLMGQRSLSEIDQTTNFLHQFFNQPNYQVLYHSGVTEAVNSIFKNFSNRANKNK
jgi:cysteine sulfinate desulfinase/cysteine desulfurase-like protein